MQNPSLMRHHLRSLARVIFLRLSRWCFNLKIVGDATLAAQGKTLIISNHESYLDGLLLGLCLPQNTIFVVHTGVMKVWYFRFILMFVDHLVVNTASPMAMKQVIRLLDLARPVVIFPEGRITVTGSLMKIYDGPAFVAAKTQVAILPVRIEGARHSYFSRLEGFHPRRLLPRIRIHFLPPTHLPKSEAGTAKQRRAKASDALRRIMQESQFATRENHTLYRALLNTIQTHHQKRRPLEDIQQTPYSYQDLLKMSLMLGRLLERQTLESDNVGLLMPNTIPSIALIFGLTAKGRTPAMLNYTAGSDGLRSACVAAQIRTIVTSRNFVTQAKLADKLAELASVTDLRILYLEDLRKNISVFDKLWLVGYALRLPARQELQPHPQKPAVIIFTSGTEGKPKGVVLSHQALLANVAQAQAVINISVHDKILNALPIFHSFGLTAGALLPLLSGAELFLYPSPLHYRVIPEIAYDRGCTALFGTNSFLAQYAKHAHPYDFYRLRYVVAGAEKLSDTVRETWFEKFGLRIFEGYGATETAPFISVNTPMNYRRGSVGQLLPSLRAQIIPVAGIDEGGMLHVQGPNLMSGYLRFENPGVIEPPASELGAGWYNTGDIVRLDEDGYVFIVGRVKRFAKIAGEMISLEVVEKMALHASPHHHHAATQLADALRGEALVLFTTDDTLTRDTLMAAARERGNSELAVPKIIHHCTALPLLGTGKIDYVQLKQWAENGGAA